MDEEPTEEDRAEFERLMRQTENDAYKFIGACITSWSRLEGTLVWVAAMLLDTDREKAGLVFYSINNFHSWLAIIEELFALDSRYTPLRSDWIRISNRLKKLNDVRVSLAHHALEPRKGIEHLAAIDDDFTSLFPTLRPNRFDTRTRSRKHTPVGMDELMTFMTDVTDLREKTGHLVEKMGPIFVDRQERLVEYIKRLEASVQEMNAYRDAIRADFGG
jgi:hypothetical protein